MKNPFQRLTILHVIALLLLMIWLQVGGAQFTSDVFGKVAHMIASVGKREEAAAPMSEAEERWSDEFNHHMYGTPPPSPASAP